MDINAFIVDPKYEQAFLANGMLQNNEKNSLSAIEGEKSLIAFFQESKLWMFLHAAGCP